MINLLPPKHKVTTRIARSNTILRRYVELIIISMVVIATSLFAAYYFLQRQQQNVRSTLETNQKKVAELEPVQKEAEELSATVNTISGLFSQNVKFSEMLTKIGGTMPPGTVLTGLQFSIENTDAPLVISAELENEERAAVLRNNLIASGLFKDVTIKTIVLNEEKPAAQQNSNTEAQAAPASNTATTLNKYRYTVAIEALLLTNSGEKK